MKNAQNDRPDAVTSDLPEQRKTLDGSSASFILPETSQENPSAGNLKRSCIHLGDADREAIQIIREELELPSSALAVRLAVRRLAEHLAQHDGN